jgi:hypothetical protein
MDTGAVYESTRGEMSDWKCGRPPHVFVSSARISLAYYYTSGASREGVSNSIFD